MPAKVAPKSSAARPAKRKRDDASDEGEVSEVSSVDSEFVAAEKDATCCDQDFTEIPRSMIKRYCKHNKCVRCRWLVGAHKVNPSRPSPERAAAVNVTVNTRTDEEKRMAKFSEAISLSKSQVIPYDHDFDLLPRINLARLIRGADADHKSLWCAPGLVTGTLPETASKEMLLRPWARMANYADVVDVLKHAIQSAVHYIPAPTAEVPIPVVRRNAIFLDVTVGRGGWSKDSAMELARALGAMAIGLRAFSVRDPRVYSSSFSSSKLSAVHPVAGKLNWFVFSRTTLMDKFKGWLEKIRDGGPLTDAPAPLAGEAPPELDGAVLTKAWPFAAVGEAIAMNAGAASSTEAEKAWAAVEAFEALVAASFKVLADGVASGGGTTGAGGGGGGGGGGGSGAAAAEEEGSAERASKARKDNKPKPKPKERQPKVDDADGPSAAVVAARAKVASKKIEDLTREDCLNARLCFRCKYPAHNKPAEGKPECTQRGTAIERPAARAR
jgi:hypothetical protein